MGGRKNHPGNCLTKHRGCAKSKDPVYSPDTRPVLGRLREMSSIREALNEAPVNGGRNYNGPSEIPVG